MKINICAKCNYREYLMPEIVQIENPVYFLTTYKPSIHEAVSHEEYNICEECTKKGFLLRKWSDLDEKCIINTKGMFVVQDGMPVYFCETHGVGFSIEFIMPDELERSNKLHGACKHQQQSKYRNQPRISNTTP